MRTKACIGPFVLGVSALLITACGSAAGTAGDDTTGDSDAPVIGVSLVTTTRGFHSEIFEGMQSAAEEHGVTLISADSKEDVVRQLDDVDGLLQQGVDGMLIVPVDDAGSTPAYESADAAGVPVISVARDANTDLKVSYVGAEWESYGQAIAKWTCANVESPATVAMIKGPSGASFVNEMATGYTGYLGEECGEVSVVFEANAQTDGAEPGVALAQDALSAYPDVDVIYVNADDTAMGVIQALVEQGKVDDVVVTGFNGEPQAFDAIRDGTLEMTFALKPYAWGRLAVESMLKYLDGEELPSLVPIETTLVDQANIKDLTEDDLR